MNTRSNHRRACLLVPALLLLACGTLTDKLYQMHTGVAGARQAAKAILDDRCMDVAEECRKTLKPGEKAEQCAPLMKCWNERKLVYKAASALQILIDTAVTLAASNKEAEAKGLYVKIVAGFASFKELLVKHKILEGL